MKLAIQKIEASYPYNLLLQADETREGIDKYLFDSDVYVAMLPDNNLPVGVFCLLQVDDNTAELMNIAVDEPFRGRGIGGLMLEKAAQIAAEKGFSELILGTGTEDCAPDQIRFYELHGFQKSGIRKGYFIEKYSEPIFENGVQLKDMQLLARPTLLPPC